MSGDKGQGTTELALALPVMAVLMLVIGQIGLVARDQVLLWHAAREGARAAAVEPSTAVARRAAIGSTPGLRAPQLAVSLTGGADPGDSLTTTLTYRSATDVPLVGALIDDVTLTASVSMRAE